MNKLHVKKGDTVVILSGGNKKKGQIEKGQRGKVLEVSVKEQKVIVEGRFVVKKHVKPRKMGEAGGIVEGEGAIHACKVMLICPKCDKPTRVAHKIMQDGTKMRLCKKCDDTF